MAMDICLARHLSHSDAALGFGYNPQPPGAASASRISLTLNLRIFCMEWSITHFWLILALVLGLAELTSGVLLLLALAIAATLTSVLAYIGMSFEWQLVGMGVFSGALAPIAVRWIRPRFSPKGVAYGTTGTGVERGKRYQTLKRDFDGATGIKVNGDFYRLKDDTTGATDFPEGTDVIFTKFDGTTAVVQAVTHKEQ